MPQPFHNIPMPTLEMFTPQQFKEECKKIDTNEKIGELGHFLIHNFRDQLSPDKHVIDTAISLLQKFLQPIEHKKGSEAVELIYSEMRNEFKKLLNQKGFDTPTWFKGYEAALWDLKIIIQDNFNIRLDEIKINDLKPKTNEQ